MLFEEEVLNAIARSHDPSLFAGADPVEVRGMLYYLYGPRWMQRARLAPTGRVLALYDPFARRSVFPAGFRLCCNVYTGCAHACAYCYTTGYIPDAHAPRRKRDFERQLLRDLQDLTASGLRSVPLHIANSTDPLQEAMEERFGDTLRLLRELACRPGLLQPVVILTKNPGRLTRPEYLDAMRSLPDLLVQVSLITTNEAALRRLEPGAPSARARMAGMQRLRSEGIRVALRLDPLFPRDPLPPHFFAAARASDYGALPPHTLQEIEELVGFAAEIGCERVIVSPLRLMCGRYPNARFRAEWEPLYREAIRRADEGERLTRSFSYRLPRRYAQQLIAEVREIAAGRQIEVVHCMEDLITRW